MYNQDQRFYLEGSISSSVMPIFRVLLRKINIKSSYNFYWAYVNLQENDPLRLLGHIFTADIHGEITLNKLLGMLLLRLPHCVVSDNFFQPKIKSFTFINVPFVSAINIAVKSGLVFLFYRSKFSKNPNRGL